MIDQVTFVEVGGFYGMTTDFVLKDQPDWKIIVLEPTPRLYHDLVEKYVDESRVRVLNIALWNKNEIRSFYASGHSGASSLCREKSNLGECEIVNVGCLRASTFLGSIDGKIVLNLNCEGAEIEIMDDLMESGIYARIKIFIKGHKDVMPKPELYDAMFAKMDEMDVEYLRGTYGKLHKRVIEDRIDIKEFFVEHGKSDWTEFFRRE